MCAWKSFSAVGLNHVGGDAVKQFFVQVQCHPLAAGLLPVFYIVAIANEG